jgi:GntR family transcriptional regulator, rspAB operon transcriptional repressor
MQRPKGTPSLATEAYSVVRQRIFNGNLVLGQAVSRRKLAEELGMSFLPVSEALQRLELEGLLESKPRAGTRVRLPSREDVIGHYVVREALEVQAAILFGQVATGFERSELRKLAARVDALSVKSDRSMYLELHQKLHQRIFEGTHCTALCEAVEKAHALAWVWLCATRNGRREAVQTRHRVLVAEILTESSERASAAVREHIAIGRDRTLEALQPFFRVQKLETHHFSRTDRNLPHAAAAGMHVSPMSAVVR